MSDLLNRIDLRFEHVASKLKNHIVSEAGCWEYQGSRRNGYGRFDICLPGDKRKFLAHRVSYAFYSGIDPSERMVCHRCDNPSCINPDHLFLGTGADNSADMADKGRAAPQAGELNHARKLDRATVIRVVEAICEGKGNKEIAATLPVTHSAVSMIRLGRAWSGLLAELGYNPEAHRLRRAA
jgi:hypothetical protein